MLKTVFISGMLLLLSTAYAFSNTGSDSKQKKTAADGAEIQRDNPDIATRIITGGTGIIMHFGDTVIPGILNDSKAAHSLISMLPYTVRVNRYSHDFCGIMDNALEYEEDNVRYGWLNGDIAFSRDANYFTILFADEEISEQYGNLLNIGVITCPLAEISSLQGSYDVLIELAD